MLAIAALFVAANAYAVDMHGYFRTGIGGSSPGGDQVTFKNAGQDYKLRLGNEDNWDEFEFDQLLLKDKNGVEWMMGWMVGFGTGFNGSELAKAVGDIEQQYVRATFPQLGGASVWGGVRYYHRHANDPIDYFYLNESGPGVGIEDYDVGFGKLAVALFRPSPGAEGTGSVFWMPDVRLEGIPVNPGGTLSIAALAKIRTWNKHLNGDKPKNTQDFSPFLMVEHSQGGILNGGNTLAVTYKTGCFVSEGGNIITAANDSGAVAALKDGLTDDQKAAVDSVLSNALSASCATKNAMLTVSEQLNLSPTKEFSVTISGMYQNIQIGYDENLLGALIADPAAADATVAADPSTKASANTYFIGVRPIFKLADHFAIQGDAGYFYAKAEKKLQDKANTMFKLTVAPTITPFTDGFYGAHSAPEIRLFGTYASWNKEQRGTTGNTFADAGKNVTSGFTFGAQAEAWF